MRGGNAERVRAALRTPADRRHIGADDRDDEPPPHPDARRGPARHALAPRYRHPPPPHDGRDRGLQRPVGGAFLQRPGTNLPPHTLKHFSFIHATSPSLLVAYWVSMKRP